MVYIKNKTNISKVYKVQTLYNTNKGKAKLLFARLNSMIETIESLLGNKHLGGSLTPLFLPIAGLSDDYLSLI